VAVDDPDDRLWPLSVDRDRRKTARSCRWTERRQMRAMLDLMQERIVQKGLPSIGVEPNRLQWRSRLSHSPP